ncbi:hypothetical protein Q4485_14925 [Granulosicoccaceae sp. 1_MG-2023]|nr:hypothetical protein [Granulosicoccaceae sp. 1_MG-2023]
MISFRYLRYACIAILLGCVCAAVTIPGRPEVNVSVVALSIVFAIPFMSLVVTRLPVFKQFYRQDQSVIHDGPGSAADAKAAGPMAALVTGGVIALVLFCAGALNVMVPALSGGIAAGFMSFYHWPH